MAQSFADYGVAIADTRGPESLKHMAIDLGPTVSPATIPDALKRHPRRGLLPTNGELRAQLWDWVVDTTDVFLLPSVDHLLNGRPPTYINAEHVAGAEMVKGRYDSPIAFRLDTSDRDAVVHRICRAGSRHLADRMSRLESQRF